MRIPEAEQCELRILEIAQFEMIRAAPELVDLHTSNLPHLDERSPFADLRERHFAELTMMEDDDLSVHALALYANAVKRFQDIFKEKAPCAIYTASWEISGIKDLVEKDPLYRSYVEDARNQAISDRE